MVERHTLSCCALAQITCHDFDSLADIRFEIDKIKLEAKYKWYQVEYGHGWGQRAAFVITTPNELNLVRNLKKLKFKPLTTFERRVGYPPGELTMWFLKW